MENVKRIIILTVLVLSAFLVLHCETAEQSPATVGKSLENVLSEMAKLGESEKKIVAFDIVFDKASHSYSYANVTIVKESLKIRDFIKGADPDFKYAENSIEVECTDAEGNVNVTNCPDYACVAYAVALCVESGGCAKVCKVAAKYYPSAIE